jgi:hypothetical protein
MPGVLHAVSPCIVCMSYFVYHTYVCLLVSSPCDYLMCTSPCKVYYCKFFRNIFRLSHKCGPLEVLTFQRAQLKQTTLAVHPE